MRLFALGVFGGGGCLDHCLGDLVPYSLLVSVISPNNCRHCHPSYIPACLAKPAASGYFSDSAEGQEKIKAAYRRLKLPVDDMLKVVLLTQCRWLVALHVLVSHVDNVGRNF